MKSIKTVFAGDSSVGKTCILNRIKDNAFIENGDATVGASNCDVRINNGSEDINFTIWDTAGQEKYRSLTPIYFNGAALAILVFDITNRSSMNELEHFIQVVQDRAPDYVKLVLVGNKADLEDRREVEYKEGETYAREIGAAFYIEVSAKTGFGTEELLQRACLIPDLHFEDSMGTGLFTSEESAERVDVREKKRCSC